jgi:zinc protease
LLHNKELAIFSEEPLETQPGFPEVPKIITLAVFLILLGGIFSCATTAKSSLYGGLGQPSDPVPFLAEARRGTLPNGLAYYILENGKPENRAYLTLVVKAGSVLEKDDEQGLAHFTEHMAFNGTVRFPESELVNYLRSLGMRFGPEVNAYTSYDQTVYGIEVPTEPDGGGRKTIPSRALAVLDDWTHAITFDPADVDDERLVIMEEYRARLGAMDRIRRKMLPGIFQGSPYADRYPIGLPELIENAPASRLQNFYKTWYRPDNMALILVGDFDGAKLEGELASHFSAPAPDTALERPEFDLPPPEKNRFRAEVFTDPELTYTRVDMYYKRSPQALRGDLASYRQGLIDNLIDRMLSFRFDEAASKPETPYVGAAAGNLRYGKSSRYYVLIAQAKTGNAEASFRELLREKESMVRYGFTEAEIDRAKRSLVSDVERMVSERDRQESNAYVQGFTNHFLSGQNVADITWELEAVKTLLPAIGARDIRATVRDYFSPNDLRVFLMGPEGEASSLMTPERMRELVKESSRAKIAPPQERVLSDELIGEDPAPGFIRSESRDPATGALIWELGNGARVILKETLNRNNEIVLYALARGGTSSVPEEEDVSASLAAEMLEASGLGPYSRTELVQKLADKQVSFSFWTSAYYRGFQGSATTGDLKTLFEMLHLSFTQPRLDPGAVEALLDQYRTALAQRGEDPETVFSDEVNRIIYGNNPRFKSLELADLAKVDPEIVMNFARRALNPGDYTFVFAGNLDAEALRAYTETYLASVPPGLPWNTWTDLGIVRPGTGESQVFKGKEERSLVFQGWYTPAPYSEAASINAQVLNEYLDILLTEEIREKLGGVYSVSVGVSVNPIPSGELTLGVYFACDPKRAAELSGAIQALFGDLAAGAVDADAFAKAREALKKSLEDSVQSNAYIAQSYANSSVLLDAPLSRLDQRPALYDAVTPGDIQQTMARALQNGPVLVILYPEDWQNRE